MNRYILNLVLGIIAFSLVGCGSLRSNTDNSVITNKTDANIHRGEYQQFSVTQSNSKSDKRKKTRKRKEIEPTTKTT